jgi:hypothetical protein
MESGPRWRRPSLAIRHSAAHAAHAANVDRDEHPSDDDFSRARAPRCECWSSSSSSAWP